MTYGGTFANGAVANLRFSDAARAGDGPPRAAGQGRVGPRRSPQERARGVPQGEPQDEDPATTLGGPYWEPDLRFDANFGSPRKLAWLTENPTNAVVSGLMFLELGPAPMLRPFASLRAKSPAASAAMNLNGPCSVVRKCDFAGCVGPTEQARSFTFL